MFGRTQVVLDVAVTRASLPLADGAINIVVSALLLLLHCIALVNISYGWTQLALTTAATIEIL